MARIGRQTVEIKSHVSIAGVGSVVGPKEAQGPLGTHFDILIDDIMAGEDTWEKAESRISEKAMSLAVSSAGITMSDVDYLLAGDLLNQCMGSVMAAKDFNVPYVGIYGACSNIGLGMGLGAMAMQAQLATHVLIGASSHFCAAEKQFRFPLELGSQRPPTSQTTVTGAGAVVLNNRTTGPMIKSVTTGKIIDMGIKDSNNMGAAMAPAAVDTIKVHLEALGVGPDYYDLIVTGDLGYVGHELVINLLDKEKIRVGKNYTDCGILIYDKETQDTHAGGSGCGCSAVTFAGYLYEKMIKDQIKKLLFVPTGALMSTTSVQQKLSIPGIAHAIGIEMV